MSESLRNREPGIGVGKSIRRAAPMSGSCAVNLICYWLRLSVTRLKAQLVVIGLD